MTSLASPNIIMMNINSIDTSENTTIHTNVNVVSLNIGISHDSNTILHENPPIENITIQSRPRRVLPPSIVVLSSDDEHDHDHDHGQDNSPNNINNINNTKESLRNKRDRDKKLKIKTKTITKSSLKNVNNKHNKKEQNFGNNSECETTEYQDKIYDKYMKYNIRTFKFKDEIKENLKKNSLNSLETSIIKNNLEETKKSIDSGNYIFSNFNNLSSKD